MPAIPSDQEAAAESDASEPDSDNSGSEPGFPSLQETAQNVLMAGLATTANQALTSSSGILKQLDPVRLAFRLPGPISIWLSEGLQLPGRP